MDVSRNAMLGELASDAASERTDYVVQATEQLRKFLDRNRSRIEELGGLVLQILGIGRTGHIGFNEPGSPPESRTRLVRIHPFTRRDAAADFFGVEV